MLYFDHQSDGVEMFEDKKNLKITVGMQVL